MHRESCVPGSGGPSSTEASEPGRPVATRSASRSSIRKAASLRRAERRRRPRPSSRSSTAPPAGSRLHRRSWPRRRQGTLDVGVEPVRSVRKEAADGRSPRVACTRPRPGTPRRGQGGITSWSSTSGPLRHAAITNALDAGVPLRDAQILARHAADPRTTEDYDRARGNLDRHGVHFLTAYVAGV